MEGDNGDNSAWWRKDARCRNTCCFLVASTCDLFRWFARHSILGRFLHNVSRLFHVVPMLSGRPGNGLTNSHGCDGFRRLRGKLLELGTHEMAWVYCESPQALLAKAIITQPCKIVKGFPTGPVCACQSGNKQRIKGLLVCHFALEFLAGHRLFRQAAIALGWSLSGGKAAPQQEQQQVSTIMDRDSEIVRRCMLQSWRLWQCQGSQSCASKVTWLQISPGPEAWLL